MSAETPRPPGRRTRRGPGAARSSLPGLDSPAGEEAWIEVIRKMDEVYNDLLEYEVALEEKNAALEQSQQFIFSVLTSMSDVLVVCDRQGRVQQVNEALATLTGRAEGDLRGAELASLFADEASRRKAADMQSRAPMETVHDCEVQLQAADGSAVPVALNCTPRMDAKGRPVGMVLVGRPIGELRRAYQALREAHEQLMRAQQRLLHSEKMASLGRLVAGVAHELNNPISFVLGNTHALARYGQKLDAYLKGVHDGLSRPDLEQLRRQLRIDHVLGDLPHLIEGMKEGAARTRDIVSALKRFATADRGEDVAFDLAEVVERSLHWVVKAGGPLRVETDLPAGLPVRGSPGQIQQVCTNIIQNALDACEGRPEPLLRIGGRVGGEWVEVSFRDSGPGIAEEHLGSIFDPFFTTKPVGRGTGLGLSISYGIVERHGGTLTAANHPEGGAVFTLRLPAPSR